MRAACLISLAKMRVKGWRDEDMVSRITFLASFACLLLSGCGLDELRKREKTLAPYCATNASLPFVKAELGEGFTVVRKGSSEWNYTVSNYLAFPSSRHLKRRLLRITNSVAYAHNSSITMQTWLFLNTNDCVIDFEVDAQ